jgi:hypothetical protein
VTNDAGSLERFRVAIRCFASKVLLAALVTMTAGCVTPRVELPPPMSPDVPAGSAAGTAPVVGQLRVEPVSGVVGDAFTVVAQGLPGGAAVQWQWQTWDGSYATQASGYDVHFMQRQYVERRVVLGTGSADATGRSEVHLTVPEDFGEVHQIYAVVGGRDVARGGYRIIRHASITPSSGPIGTMVVVRVTGLGWQPFESTMALRYDQGYTGFVSAVTTGGSAEFQLRAAGPVGGHVIQLTAASAGVPFLNNQQSGTAYIPNMDIAFPFTVTGDNGPPTAADEWPAADRTTSVPARPQARLGQGVTAEVVPADAPVGTDITLKVAGLAPGGRVQVLWALGGEPDSSQPPPFRELGAPAGDWAIAQDGSLVVPIHPADDRGGWHVIRVMQGSEQRAEVPVYVRRSMVGLPRTRVHAGEVFTVQVKGSGWTELDKGVAVTYDNSFIGYACSATSGGDITLRLVATGAPGTHLIDMYPMIYRQPGDHPPEYWDFDLPQLTALRDHPGLALGYELPIFHTAIEVTD